MSYEDWMYPLIAMGCTIEPCGSRVTCDPAPTDTDQDYLVVTPKDRETVSEVVNYLHGEGFAWEGSEHYQEAAAGDFMSWRQRDVNLIVTASESFATRHRVATQAVKQLNILDKKHRIEIFQAILYGDRKNDDVPY